MILESLTQIQLPLYTSSPLSLSQPVRSAFPKRDNCSLREIRNTTANGHSVRKLQQSGSKRRDCYQARSKRPSGRDLIADVSNAQPLYAFCERRNTKLANRSLLFLALCQIGLTMRPSKRAERLSWSSVDRFDPGKMTKPRPHISRKHHGFAIEFESVYRMLSICDSHVDVVLTAHIMGVC